MSGIISEKIKDKLAYVRFFFLSDERGVSENLVWYAKSVATCLLSVVAIGLWFKLFFFGHFFWGERVIAAFAMAFGCLVGFFEAVVGGGEVDSALDGFGRVLFVFGVGSVLSLVSLGVTTVVVKVVLAL